jgi:hypothetical protein
VLNKSCRAYYNYSHFQLPQYCALTMTGCSVMRPLRTRCFCHFWVEINYPTLKLFWQLIYDLSLSKKNFLPTLILVVFNLKKREKIITSSTCLCTIPHSFVILVKRGRLGGISGTPLLPLQGSSVSGMYVSSAY